MSLKTVNKEINRASYFHGVELPEDGAGMIKDSLVQYTGKYPPDMSVLKKEFTPDDGAKIAAGAIKYDGGKAPIYRGALAYFPRAIEAVAAVSAFGANKYAWKGWEGVADGVNRYSDAMVRHLAYEGKGEVLDPDSGLLHAAHTAWNSLARLELLIKQQEPAKEREDGRS